MKSGIPPLEVTGLTDKDENCQFDLREGGHCPFLAAYAIPEENLEVILRIRALLYCFG